MDVYIYEGNKKDETDILLSMIVSKKMPYIKKHKNKVIILTNDHFGICIKKILERNDICCDVIKSLN